MHEVAEKSVGWLVLGGIVLAVLAARGRYKGKFAASVAAAHAAGYAAAKVDLGVSQTVNVQAGNTAHGLPAGDHQCADPFACEVCSAVLLRVLRAGGRGGAPLAVQGRRESDYDYVDNGTTTTHNARMERRVHRVADGVEFVDSGSSSSDRSAAADGADPGGVEVIPCASLDELPDEVRRAIVSPNGSEIIRRMRDHVHGRGPGR